MARRRVPGRCPMSGGMAETRPPRLRIWGEREQQKEGPCPGKDNAIAKPVRAPLAFIAICNAPITHHPRSVADGKDHGAFLRAAGVMTLRAMLFCQAGGGGPAPPPRMTGIRDAAS